MKIQPGVGYTFDSSSKGFTLDTSDPFPSPDGQKNNHPFKVLAVGPVGSNFRYQIVSGTINNLVPEIDDIISGVEVLLDKTTSGVPTPPTGQLSINTSTKESWIYLRSGAETTSPYAYPDTSVSNAGYPKVISSDVELTDSDTYGYILIAKFDMDSATAPTTGALYQYVSSSLWADRIKLGTTTAKYYYARI
jgi:hypothetical protein